MEKVYLLYGKNRELMDQRKNEIINESGIDEFNVSLFDLSEKGLNEALADAQSIPFLSDKRIVVFKNCAFFSTDKGDEAKRQEKEFDMDSFKSYLENYPEFTVSIFMSPYETIDSKKVIVKLVKDLEGVIEECPIYTKEEITRWIDMAIKNSGHTYTIDARNEILARLDQDPNNFKNEMEKLFLYLKPGEKITKEIVELMIIKNPEDKLYELSNAILNKDKSKAISIYYDLLQKNDSLTILRSIENKFQEILYSKELIKSGISQEEFASTLHITKGKAYFMMKNAKETSYETLNLWFDRMIKLDYEIKLGKVDQNAGVELLILKS
ncbi:MAG: DNA polymerase III subunit delta [Gammaproteobacteria bacterium]|nr:DNA polymerase III subunit delta [Gammaproteobacteria bacterium]